MRSRWKGCGVARSVVASLLVIGLAACDQLQSLWKGDKEASPAPSVQQQVTPKAAEEKTNPIKVGEARAPAEATKIDADKELAARVKSALGADASLRTLAIDASSANGIVTLWGTADTRAHRDRAGKVASEVPGVQSVKNELVIVAGS